MKSLAQNTLRRSWPLTLTALLIACSGGGGGGGDTPAGEDDDGTAPVISGIQVATDANGSATVTWTTDEPSTSEVEYGLDTNYGARASSSGRTSAHSIVLTNLALDQLYHYRVHATDEAGNSAVSPDGAFLIPGPGGGSGSGEVSGSLIAWQPLEVVFRGPTASETDDSPNPFLDYRLVLELDGPSGQRLFVSGFFDGDGAGGPSGDVWKVRLALEEGGAWSYRAHFVAGSEVALSLLPGAGTPTAFHGASGTIAVAPRDAQALGFAKWGRLEYVGEPYLRFRDGPYFLKGGVAGPENLLAYDGIDNTVDQPGGGDTTGLSFGLHRFGAHVADWRPGDPLFQSAQTGTDSKGIIGAINYLSDANVNALGCLLLNLEGDGREVAPFVGYGNNTFDKTHYDLSKLAQWNSVFEHAQERGIVLQLFLGETAGSAAGFLDGGSLGVERKLFYREMVARFGHLLALQWNLSESSNQASSALDEYADYLLALDAHDHPLAFQTTDLPQSGAFASYDEVLGSARYSAASLRSWPGDGGRHAQQWRASSEGSGHAWAVSVDEQLPSNAGLRGTNASDFRKKLLWDVYFSGGQLDFSLGLHPLPLGGDLRLEDFRTRDEMWRYAWNARSLIEGTLPFWEMEPADHLLSGESNDFGGGEVFAKTGEVYAIYLPSGEETGVLDLSAAPGSFSLGWYNPRTGQAEGNLETVTGGAPVALGTPPDGGSGPAGAPAYQAQNGLVVVEVEDVPTAGNWHEETDIPGFTGSSFYRWGGPNLFSSPGSGILSYDFYVPTTGRYQLRIRNFHDHPDSTEENDSWVRMDAGNWTKVYSGEKDKWTWFSRFDPGHQDAFYDLTAGVHTLQISGRSENFRIDRWHLYLDGTPNPLDPSSPQSPFQPVGSAPAEDWVVVLRKQ